MWHRLPLLVVLSLVTACQLSARLDPALIEKHSERLERLILALDPAYPATKSILEEWQSGQRKVAAVNLDAFLNSLSFDTGLLDPVDLPHDARQQAKAALDNRLSILGTAEQVPARDGSLLDWDYRGPSEDKEFAWMLNRHAIFPILSDAWKATGDIRYREQLNALWQDWILSNPAPGRLTFSAQWRSLEVARRVLNAWLPVLFDPGSGLDPETRLLATASLLDHAEALYRYPSFWGGNHLITEKTALLALASAYPVFMDAATWRQDGLGSVTSEILKQTYPDGSYMELSNHYQRVVLVNTLPFLRLLGRMDPAYRDHPVYKRIEAMWDFFAGSTRPDGTGPLSNASDREYNAAFLLDAWHVFNRPDWLAIATGGQEGVLPPAKASRIYPWAGQVFIRSNWGKTADWIYLDAGPYGTAHQHVDRMHLSVSLQGRNLLSDSGRYTYQPGKWRDYFKGPQSHSIILLDGQPATQGPRRIRAPMPVTLAEKQTHVFAGAASQFNPPGGSLTGAVPWTRSVLYDRRGFVIVFDHLVTFRKQQARVLWQFDPAISPEEAAHVLQSGGAVAPESVVFARGELQGQPAGHFSPEYNQIEDAVRMDIQYSINRPTTLVHVIHPGEQPPIRVETHSGEAPDSLDFTVLQSGKELSRGTLLPYPQPRLFEYLSR